MNRIKKLLAFCLSLPIDYCEDCGYTGIIDTDYCPVCEKKLTQIRQRANCCTE